MSEHFRISSQPCLASQLQAKTLTDRRLEKIELLRLAVQSGKYWIPGEMVARRMIERHLFSHIQ